jgi:hypothetical protein
MNGVGAERQRVEEFLARFFAPPNAIPLSQIIRGRWERVLPWVNDLRAEPSRATVLPCWRDKRVTWYALAFSQSQIVALGEDLLAFVGPTYSTFRGHRTVLEPDDPIDSAVLELTAGLAFRFTGPSDASDARDIWAALELMRRVDARRPRRGLEALRPTGRVLRDFYMALWAGNAISADAHLRYLSDRGRLDPINVLFLRVQAMAELGDWIGLLDRAELPDLLQMRRPVAVSDALMGAVYHVELERFEAMAAVEEAVAHFRASVLPRYGTLLVRRSGIRSGAAVKLLMMRAVSGYPPDPETRDALLDTADLSTQDRLYLRLLAQHLPTAPAPADSEALTAAVGAQERGHYDQVFTLLLNASSSVRRTRLLLECAYELQTLDAEREAVRAIEGLDEKGREAALRGRLHRETYDRIVGLSARPLPEEPDAPHPVHAPDLSVASEAVPSSWIEWLDHLAASPGWERAVEVARRGATEWSVEELLSTPGGPVALSARLASARDSAALQYALPHILTFYQRDAGWPRAELAEAYVWTLEQLAVGSHGGEDDLSAFHELAQAILSLGAGGSQYERLVDAAGLLATGASSYQGVTWGLDLLDLLVVYPCPREELRLRFLMEVTGLFRKYWLRLDQSQWVVLRTLCEELGEREILEGLLTGATSSEPAFSTGGDVLAALSGKTVAVYTLTERAGRRMQEILQHRAPGVTVAVSHEKVGSESLRQLARRADIFIVATASAKHAATGFINAHRPNLLPTLRPSGKGTASMLRALHDYLRSVEKVSPLLA